MEFIKDLKDLDNLSFEKIKKGFKELFFFCDKDNNLFYGKITYEKFFKDSFFNCQLFDIKNNKEINIKDPGINKDVASSNGFLIQDTKEKIIENLKVVLNNYNYKNNFDEKKDLKILNFIEILNNEEGNYKKLCNQIESNINYINVLYNKCNSTKTFQDITYGERKESENKDLFYLINQIHYNIILEAKKQNSNIDEVKKTTKFNKL